MCETLPRPKISQWSSYALCSVLIFSLLNFFSLQVLQSLLQMPHPDPCRQRGKCRCQRDGCKCGDSGHAQRYYGFAALCGTRSKINFIIVPMAVPQTPTADQ